MCPEIFASRCFFQHSDRVRSYCGLQFSQTNDIKRPFLGSEVFHAAFFSEQDLMVVKHQILMNVACCLKFAISA